MKTLSSETIAKALKGGSLSSKQKISKALEAWNDNTFFFPNKDEFLLTWICSCFAKPNTKKVEDCCVFQTEYWELLLELLCHYEKKCLQANGRAVPFIQINMLAPISLLLQEIYNPKSSIRSDQKSEFLALIASCIKLLFSVSFSSSYRPAFEHVSAVTDGVLNALETQIKTLQNISEDNKDSLEKLISIAQQIMLKFDSQLVLAANQKKVFFTLVEKSLAKFLSVRLQLKNVRNSETCYDLSQQITQTICNALFHPDIVLEYTSVLKDASNDNSNTSKQTTYITKLFDVIEKIANDPKQMANSADIVPILLSGFLFSFRQKRSTNTGSAQDVNTKVEFGMFMNLWKIVKIIESLDKSVYLDTLSRLLKEFLSANLYSARNDSISKEHFSILDGITKKIVDHAKDRENFDQGIVLEILDTLLQIDLSLIEPRIQLIWPIMLNPEEKAEGPCIRFATSVLTTFSASRQIDGFVEDLIRHINKIKHEDAQTVLQKPMFKNSFLKAFSESVLKYMPVPQAFGIFQQFSQNLFIVDRETRGENTKKKRKLTTEKSESRLLLTSIYFCKFVSALKLNSRQKLELEEPSAALFKKFIKPCLKIWSIQSAFTHIIPALQVHATLTRVLFENYTQKLHSEDFLWTENTLVAIFNDIKECSSDSSCIAAVLCVNGLLQHTYYHNLLKGGLSLENATNIVNMIMDFVSENDGSKLWLKCTTWNGTILGISEKNQAKVACWKLITDEWFETFVQFLESSRSEKFIHILYDTMRYENDSLNQQITAAGLTKRLLRSANFYEAKLSKDWSIRVFLKEITDLFKVGFSLKCSNPVLNTTAELISKISLKETPAIDRGTTAAIWKAIQSESTAMEEDLDIDTKKTNGLVTLLNILLLFPNEYFGKNERALFVNVSTLLDIWCVANSQLDLLTRSKISSICKSINLQYINFFSINSIFGLDSEILAWLVTSSHKLALRSKDINGNVSCVLSDLSNELERQVLRKILTFASTKSSNNHAIHYLENTSQRCVNSTKEFITSGLPTECPNLLHSLISFLSSRKMSSETDLSSIVYTTDTIVSISSYVTAALKEAKKDVSLVLKQTGESSKEIQDSIISQNSSVFQHTNHTLYLVRLLYGYNRALGEGNAEAFPSKTISESLTELTSPIIQLLQSMFDGTASGVICKLATGFISALCSVPTDDCHIKASKHILATFWFIYSLMQDIGDTASIKLLSETFVSWIKNSSREHFDLVVSGFIEQAEVLAASDNSIEKEKKTLVFIQLVSLLFSASTEYQKSKLKKHIPVLIIKIILIAEKTASLIFLQKMLKFLDQLTIDESYRLSSFDLSLVVSCLVQIARPDIQSLKGQIDLQLAQELFADLCQILSHLMRHYKEQMTDVMPPFIAIAQSLLHCFKSGHVYLVSGLNVKKRVSDSKKASRTIALLCDFAPLNDIAAQQYSRLLKTIPQKQHSYIAGKSGRTNQSVMKAISRHTPSILIEYFTIQSNVNTSIIQPSIKLSLTNALYDILDLCTDDDRSFIMTCLDAPGKLLFKDFYSSWKTNHKYTGQ